MVDLESDAFPFIAESNAGFSTSNGLGGISDFDSNGPFGVSLDRLSSQESSRKMTSTSPSSSSFVLTTSTNAAAADPVMPSTSRNSSSNFLDELCGVGNGGTMQQQQNRSSQENEYLKELTELLQDTLSRPDSSLRNVEKSMLMDLVKRLKQQSKDKPENAVQHEDVSSSGSILLASHIGPMILEYLDGFFFVMNTDGFVEFVSQNVSKYLKFDQSEMVNKPIYNFVAAEHHDLFSGLLPENMAWNLLGFGNNFDVVRDSSPKPKNNGADSLPLKQQQQRKSHRFMCQFLTNAAAECSSADILPTYQNLQVTAICLPLPSNSSGFGDEDDFHLSFNVMTESQPCLVCVARRLPERSTTNFEGCQFSFRCNKSGLILDVNLKEKVTSQLLPKDISSSAMQIQQLFHVQDASFFEKVLQNDCSIKLPSISILKLFHSTINNYVPVQVKCSKIGQSNSSASKASNTCSASGLFSPPPLSPDSFHNVPFVQFDFLVLRSDDNQSLPSSNSAATSFSDFFIYDSKDCVDRLKNPLDKQHQAQETFPDTHSIDNRNINNNNVNISSGQTSSSSSAPYPPSFDDSTLFLNEDFHYYGSNEKNLNAVIDNTMGGLIGDDFRQCFENESDPSSLDVKPQLKPPLTIKSPSTIASVAVSTPPTPLDFNVNAANVVAASTQQQQTSSFNQRSVSVMSEPIAAASSFFHSSTSQIASQTEVQENDLQRFCQIMNLPPTSAQDMTQSSPFLGNQLDQTNHIESSEQVLQEGHTILKELLSQEEKQQQQQATSNVSFCEQPFHSPMLQSFTMQQQYFAPLQPDVMIGPPPPAPSHLQQPLPPPPHTPNGKRKNKAAPRKNAATTKKNSKKAANSNNMDWIPNQSFCNLANHNTQSSTIDVSHFVQNRTAKNPLNCMSSPLQQQQTHILQQLLQEDEICNTSNTAEMQVNAKMALGKRKASTNAHGQPITPPAFFLSPASQFVAQNQQAKSESLLIQLLERPLASHANQTRSLATSLANTQFDKIAKENQENPNKQPIISTLIVESLLNNSKNAKQQQQFNQNTTFSSGFYQPRPSICQNSILTASPFIGQNVSQILSPNNNPYSQMLDAPVHPPSDNSSNFAGQNRNFSVNNSSPIQSTQESFMEILSQGTTSRTGLQMTPTTLHSPPHQMMPPQNQRTFPNNCPMSNTSTVGNMVEIYDISPPNSYGQPNKLNPPNLPQTVRQRNNNQGNPPQPKKPRQRNTNSTKKPSKKQQQQEQQQQQQQQAISNQQYLASPSMNNFSASTYQAGNVLNQQQFYYDRNESAVGFGFPIQTNQERFPNGQNRFAANKQQNIGVNDNISNYPSPNNGPFSPMRNGPTTFQQNAAFMTRPPASGCASTSHQNNFKNLDPLAQQLNTHQQQRFVAHQQPQVLPNGAFVNNNNQQQPQMTFHNRQRIWSDSDNQFMNRHQQSNKTLSHVTTLPSLTNQDLSPFDQHEPIAAASSDQIKNRRRPRAVSSSEIAPMFNNNAASVAIPRQQNLNSAEQTQQIFGGQSTQRQPQTASGAVHQNANEWWTMNVDLDGEPDMDDEVTQNLLKMLNES